MAGFSRFGAASKRLEEKYLNGTCVTDRGAFESRDCVEFLITVPDTTIGAVMEVVSDDSPNGEVSLDFTGKKSGRGAYICKSVKCLRRAAKAKRIDKSLECSVPEEVYERMEKELSENE